MGIKVGKFKIDSDPKDPPVMALAGKLVSDQIYYVSHNWSDKTTWWTRSIKVTNKALVRDGVDGRIYDSGEPHWIDVSHGKLYRERSSDYDDYRVVVTVDGVVKTQTTIDADAWPNFQTQDGDYEVDFVAGQVKFLADPGASADVRATFYKVNPVLSAAEQSVFVVRPRAGKKIKLEKVEVQFEKGIEIRDTICSAPFIPVGGGIYVEVPGQRGIYQTWDDYLAEAQGNYPVIPGGFIAGKRGIANDVIQLPWNWVGAKTFDHASGVEIRVWLENGRTFTPPVGSRGMCSVTFYCLEYDQ